jgi:TolB protein
VRRLTANDVEEHDPAWSPDGRRIAFTRLGAGRTSLWVMQADGTAQRRLYSADTIASPTWSPDGRRIAFAGFERAPVVQIYVIPVQGGTPRPVPGALGFEPAWSPDGRRLAFARPERETVNLAVIPAVGGAARTITVGDERLLRAASPSWSPDGRWIVFIGVIGCGPGCEEYRIARIRPDGSGLEELALGPGSGPAFSPDGRSIVYSSFPQAGGELRILRLGSASRTITRGPGRAVEPDWQALRRR